MTVPDDIIDITASDPLEVVLEIDRRLRPTDLLIEDEPTRLRVHSYCSAAKHACDIFGVALNVHGPEPEDESFTSARRWFQLTKSEMDKKKIDLLQQKMRASGTIVLDSSWRDKIHSYLRHVRQIVEGAGLPASMRESIMSKLNALDAEVDRGRTRAQGFTDVLVGLCEGLSVGAEKLTPAIRVVERLVGALSRVRPEPSVPRLPPPERFGLSDAEDGSAEPAVDDQRGGVQTLADRVKKQPALR